MKEIRFTMLRMIAIGTDCGVVASVYDERDGKMYSKRGHYSDAEMKQFIDDLMFSSLSGECVEVQYARFDSELGTLEFGVVIREEG